MTRGAAPVRDRGGAPPRRLAAARPGAIPAAAVLVAALLVAALLLTGCGGGHDRSGGGTPAQRSRGDRPRSDAAQIQAVLDRRAAALATGRPAAYAATAAGPQRAADARAGRVAAQLGLRDVALRLRSADVRGDRAVLRVGAAWGVRGVRGTFVAQRRMRAVREPHGWRVAGVRADRGSAPWEVAAYVRHDLRHFAVLAPVDPPIADADLQRTLDAGYVAIRHALPAAPLKQRYLVIVASSATAARRMTLDIRGVEGLAAISDTAVQETGPAQRVSKVVSQRLLVVWPAFAALGEDERRRVVAHELTHAVLAESTSGRTPSWLVEGIALYVSGDRRSDQVSAALAGTGGNEGRLASSEFSLRRLSGPDAIAGLSGARQAGAYAYASAAAFALADAYGSRALLRLYDAFNDEALRGRPGPALVDRALRRAIGKGLDEFEVELRAGLS